MNYSAHYDRLIERARTRTLTGYVERHHVAPRCLDKTATDVVRLTPEEHYTAHQLLVRMHPGHVGLTWAAISMTTVTPRMTRKNKLYGWLRRRHAETMSKRFVGHKVSAESRAKMSASHKGIPKGPHSNETKLKMSLVSKGRPKSLAHCAALSKARIAMFANRKAG